MRFGGWPVHGTRRRCGSIWNSSIGGRHPLTNDPLARTFRSLTNCAHRPKVLFCVMPQSSSPSESLPQPPGPPGPLTSYEPPISNHTPTTISFPEAEDGRDTDLKTKEHLDGASIALGHMEKGAQKLINPRPRGILNKISAYSNVIFSGLRASIGAVSCISRCCGEGRRRCEELRAGLQRGGGMQERQLEGHPGGLQHVC